MTYSVFFTDFDRSISDAISHIDAETLEQAQAIVIANRNNHGPSVMISIAINHRDQMSEISHVWGTANH